MPHENKAPFFDRIVAAGSYLTLGTIGMIWFILNALFIRRDFTKYLIQNLIQSFIISILIAIIGLGFNIILAAFIGVPFIGKLFVLINYYVFSVPIFMTMSLINCVLFLFICYLAIGAVLGKFPFVPFVTKITKQIYK